MYGSDEVKLIYKLNSKAELLVGLQHVNRDLIHFSNKLNKLPIKEVVVISKSTLIKSIGSSNLKIFITSLYPIEFTTDFKFINKLDH